ncbi:hypothetical protein [uncultured Thiodictyon sp.]|uniref:hypothetical protein n=1 Tax=uncultured Thiodictyon sp. TaxID=1846217 RepID=UPI0026013C64|nr:hypothetical protein [uncultured Thiodictyon sp.]
MTPVPPPPVKSQPVCGASRAALALALGLTTAAAAAGPTIWGYGVKPCRDFLAAAPGDTAPSAVGGNEYLRYREWLAGLVTGLNLATATDVLSGAELDAALNSIRARCQARPSDDFFSATMNLVRSLSRTKGKAPK